MKLCLREMHLKASVLITYSYFQIMELWKFWQSWTENISVCVLESVH